jgi:hypothetical protein
VELSGMHPYCIQKRYRKSRLYGRQVTIF